jgi:hypothetical protein
MGPGISEILTFAVGVAIAPCRSCCGRCAGWPRSIRAHWRSAVRRDRVQGIGAFIEDLNPAFRHADH